MKTDQTAAVLHAECDRWEKESLKIIETADQKYAALPPELRMEMVMHELTLSLMISQATDMEVIFGPRKPAPCRLSPWKISLWFLFLLALICVACSQ